MGRIPSTSRCPLAGSGDPRPALTSTRTARPSGFIDRCGGNSCYDAAAGKMSDLDPILHFDENGKLIKSFGAGMIVFPHGTVVDRDDNVWVTDGNDNRPGPGTWCGGRGGRRWGARRGRWTRSGCRWGGTAGSRCGTWTRRAGRRSGWRDQRTSGLQVQSRRQAAADARQAGRRGRSGYASISRTTCSWRRAATSSCQTIHGAGGGVDLQVRQDRKVPEQVGQARAARDPTRRRAESAAYARDGLEGPAVRRQPRAATASRSSTRTASSSISGCSSAGRAACSSTRTTTSMSPTRSRARATTRRILADGSAASASAARRTAR